MAVQIQNLPKKNFGQPQFTISCPSWWNSNEQVPQLFSKRISFKVDSSSSPKIYHEAKHLGRQLLDHETSSVQSIGQSQDSMGAVGETNSQDQCFSSESGEDENHGKGVEGKMKPVFFFSPPDSAGNPSQADYGHSKVHDAHSYGDTYCGGFFTSYGSQAVIQPQIVPHIMGMTGARIPLPLNLTDNGPIYVNAKQYHGILRRRQSRAKLEARNKLVKARKPYLHESRHLHALNRVRGSGGRFLGTKKLQKPNPSPSTDTISVSDTIQPHQKNVPLDLEIRSGTGQSLTSNATCSVVSKNGVFGQPDDCFSGISTHVSGRLESNERFICASQPSGESGRRTRPCHRLGNSSLAPSLYLQ